MTKISFLQNKHHLPFPCGLEFAQHNMSKILHFPYTMTCFEGTLAGRLLLHLGSIFRPVDTEYITKIKFLLDYKGATFHHLHVNFLYFLLFLKIK